MYCTRCELILQNENRQKEKIAKCWIFWKLFYSLSLILGFSIDKNFPIIWSKVISFLMLTEGIFCLCKLSRLETSVYSVIHFPRDSPFFRATPQNGLSSPGFNHVEKFDFSCSFKPDFKIHYSLLQAVNACTFLHLKSWNESRTHAHKYLNSETYSSCSSSTLCWFWLW